MKPPDRGEAFAFRPVSPADLPMLAEWLAEPHVARWWEDPDGERVNEIAAAITDAATRPMIVELSGRPIGYLQSYDPHLEEGHPYRDQPVGTLGIDQFIGPPDLVGLGYGSRFIREYVEHLFREGCPRVILDPHPDNSRAIRAYEKAGFRAFDERDTVFGRVLLMARNACAEV